jgi:hypothetical protein
MQHKLIDTREFREMDIYVRFVDEWLSKRASDDD